MERRSWVAGLVVAGLIAIVAVAPVPAGASAPSGSSAATRGYIDPFTSSEWQVSRTDMGVDWAPMRTLPVLAIGKAVILGSETRASWPGHHLIWYQLESGSHAGDVVYVAEHLTKLLPAGTQVHSGQQIALALPGYPWIETGWANTYGSPLAWPCYKEGRKTQAGKEMSRFLQELGAPAGDPAGNGPDHPVGTRCA